MTTTPTITSIPSRATDDGRVYYDVHADEELLGSIMVEAGQGLAYDADGAPVAGPVTVNTDADLTELARIIAAGEPQPGAETVHGDPRYVEPTGDNAEELGATRILGLACPDGDLASIATERAVMRVAKRTGATCDPVTDAEATRELLNTLDVERWPGVTTYVLVELLDVVKAAVIGVYHAGDVVALVTLDARARVHVYAPSAGADPAVANVTQGPDLDVDLDDPDLGPKLAELMGRLIDPELRAAGMVNRALTNLTAGRHSAGFLAVATEGLLAYAK